MVRPHGPPPTPGTKPNIVIMFIDDMVYGDIGPFGNKVNKTQTSTEIFLNDGDTVLTLSIIHELDDTKFLFESDAKTTIESMEINEVTGWWK